MAKNKVYRNPANGYTVKVKDGFNWVVFFFGPLWYLFNGHVGQGLVWTIVAAVAGVFTVGIGAIIVWIIAGAKANQTKETGYLEKGWEYLGHEHELNNSVSSE